MGQIKYSALVGAISINYQAPAVWLRYVHFSPPHMCRYKEAVDFRRAADGARNLTLNLTIDDDDKVGDA